MIEEVVKVDLTAYPPGHVGVASHFLGRYREFDACLARLIFPQGCSYQYYMGVDVCKNFNSMVRTMMKHEQFQWLWILGDDHLFSEHLLIDLLARDVDVVTPLCCRRIAPYFPVLHRDEEKKEDTPGPDLRSYPAPWDEIQDKTGLIEWAGASGNAGMLIKRKVFETIPDPWFENGKVFPGVGASDLYFWHKLHQYGFKTYLDLENLLGHITHAALWPRYNPETGKWFFQMVSP